MTPPLGWSRTRSIVGGSDDVDVHLTLIGCVGSRLSPDGKVIVSALTAARKEVKRK